MKTAFNICIFVLFGTVAATSRGQNTAVPPPTPYTIVSRSMSERLWQRTLYDLSPSGQSVPRTQQYTELSDDICYFKDGHWLDSQPEIVLLPDGSACGTNSSFQALFLPDLGDGPIKLISPEGLQIQLSPAALCYDDGSNTVILATVTNSLGTLIGSQQVLYSHAFSGIDADILYTYGQGGRFEQDVILHQRPQDPQSLGLNPQNACLKMLTAFVTPSQPTVTPMTVQTADGQVTDETLEFGSIEMIPGQAFILGTNRASVNVTKQWIRIDNSQFLLESVPVSAVADGLSTLPASAARQSSHGRLRDTLMALHPEHHVVGKRKGRISISKTVPPTSGLVMDFVTVSGVISSYVFQGDNTYYISAGGVTLHGTNTFEGGAVIKYTNGASILIAPAATPDGIIWNAQAALPVIFTAKDDNSVGSPVSGSTGSPTGYYANPALNLIFSTATAQPISEFRIAYAQEAVSLVGTHPPNFYNGQIVNCEGGFNADGMNGSTLENILFANVQTNFNNLFQGSFYIENCTFCSSTNLATIENSPFQSDLLYFTNCVFANIFNLSNSFGGSITFSLNADNDGFYDAPAFGSVIFTNSTYPFQQSGAGSYYLTNICAFRGAGTTNIDPSLLAALATKTTWPPFVYSNAVFSTNTILGPYVPRDTNNSPDLGYHYDCLDYVFGGCDLYSNLTFMAGTAVGWFEDFGGVSSSGQPYAISLNGGANLSFNGNVIQPDIFTRYAMVQEAINGNWTSNGSMGAIMFNGGSPEPQLSANFTKLTSDDWNDNIFRDNSASGAGDFENSEFYNGLISTYDVTSLTFTNCLFFRFNQSFLDSPDLAFENCTFYGGGLFLGRASPVTWLIENCSFDGTAFDWSDSYHGTSYTTINYNAYNTNNFSWLTNSLYGGYYGTNEVVGPNDLMLTNYNFQTSWFGKYYLPTNSPIFEEGSTNANLLGLYHFTTQTNQIPDGTNIVTIGYHYVATDQYGNPLDSNGDGIPDYLEDPAGNGSGNWDTTMFLNVIITQPQNGSTIP